MQFLERLYGKPSLSFTEYAAQNARKFSLSDEPGIRRSIPAGAVRMLMEQEQLTQRDIQELFGIEDRSVLQKTISVLRDGGFLRRVGSAYYVKTPAAIRWLREELSLGASGDDARSAQGRDTEQPDF